MASSTMAGRSEDERFLGPRPYLGAKQPFPLPRSGSISGSRADHHAGRSRQAAAVVRTLLHFDEQIQSALYDYLHPLVTAL